MEQLSSCYFCGGALDSSLDEYPVVPKRLHPTTEDQKTVVLCQGCRQKLGTVVETIVSVAESPESSAGENVSNDDGWVDAGELQSQDEASAADNASAEDVSAGEDGHTDDGTAADDSDDVTYTTSTAAGGRKSVSGNAESIREESSTTGGDDESGAENSGDGTSSDETGGGGSETDDRPTMSALENTKVMRLLQNREFPVDREEIRTVATNAYDLDESHFDAVVNAAVDRGLIGEEDGQFVEGH